MYGASIEFHRESPPFVTTFVLTALVTFMQRGEQTLVMSHHRTK